MLTDIQSLQPSWLARVALGKAIRDQTSGGGYEKMIGENRLTRKRPKNAAKSIAYLDKRGWSGRAGPGRVAQNSTVIRVNTLGIPKVNEVIFLYKEPL